MTLLYFEDAEVGAACKAGPYLVSKEEIIQFAKQYDPIPRHIDEEAAARSIFGGLTASGAHTFAVFISLTPKLQPRFHVLTAMGFDELRLPNPVRPEDELNLETIVLEMRESKSKSDRGIVRNQMRLRNQRREIVLQCISNILVARPTDGNIGVSLSTRYCRLVLLRCPLWVRTCRPHRSNPYSITSSAMVRRPRGTVSPSPEVAHARASC